MVLLKTPKVFLLQVPWKKKNTWESSFIWGLKTKARPVLRCQCGVGWDNGSHRTSYRSRTWGGVNLICMMGDGDMARHTCADLGARLGQELWTRACRSGRLRGRDDRSNIIRKLENLLKISDFFLKIWALQKMAKHVFRGNTREFPRNTCFAIFAALRFLRKNLKS